MTLTSINSTQTGVNSTPNTNGNFATGMFPVYYIPTQQRPLQSDQNHLSTGFQGKIFFSHFFEYSLQCVYFLFLVQYMPGMMYNYNTLFPASPIFCSPLSMVPVPLTQPIAPIHTDSNNIVPTTTAVSTEHKLSPPSVRSVPQFQRPASQATSVKAEPGSAMGSIASASIANKVSL